ncbi:MAG TPA: RNA methyltransferase [Halalkalibaculum sp.]|nr:RNA methyltransferase [Halalkalibaculum sp.]
MDLQTKEELVGYLRNFITEERWITLNKVLQERTRYFTVVLEDIYQSHNASAVLRSCDCFGIQDVHIIENDHNFSLSKGVTIGADRWLTLHKYRSEGSDNTLDCFSELREKGYRIIATTPHEEEVTIDKLPIDSKTALVFGAELPGLSETAIEHADGFVKIPIYGFSESYNISVSAALCLYEISQKLRKSNMEWKLMKSEKQDLRLEWLENSIRASDMLKEKFFKEKQ